MLLPNTVIKSVLLCSRAIPRPDLRESPDNVVVHLPGPMEGNSPDLLKSTNKGCDDEYNPILNRDLEHPTS